MHERCWILFVLFFHSLLIIWTLRILRICWLFLIGVSCRLIGYVVDLRFNLVSSVDLVVPFEESLHHFLLLVPVAAEVLLHLLLQVLGHGILLPIDFVALHVLHRDGVCLRVHLAADCHN